MSLAFMDNYARIRKMLYAPAPRPIVVPKPKAKPKQDQKTVPAFLQIVKELKTVTVTVEWRQCYIVPIQGPCEPDHPLFDVYNGGRDWLHIKSGMPNLKIEDCIDFIVKRSGISRTILLGNQRTQDLVTARHEAMWIAKKYTGRSLPEIGRRMGGRDHTTILHGVRKREALKASGDWVPPTLEEVATFAQSRKQ